MLARAKQQTHSGRWCLACCSGVFSAFWTSSSLSPSKQCLSQGSRMVPAATQWLGGRARVKQSLLICIHRLFTKLPSTSRFPQPMKQNKLCSLSSSFSATCANIITATWKTFLSKQNDLNSKLCFQIVGATVVIHGLGIQFLQLAADT